MGKIGTSAAAAAIGLCAAAQVASANATNLFRSGTVKLLDSGSGTFSYLQLNNNYVGIEFTLNQPAATSSVAAVMRAFNTATVYGTVAPITPGGIPDLNSIPAGQIGVVTVLGRPATSGSVRVEPYANRVLMPGRHALIFGTGAFGTSGDASILADPDNVTPLVADNPFTVFNASGGRINQLGAPIASEALGSFLSAPGPGVTLRGPESQAGKSLITFETLSTGLPSVPNVTFVETPIGSWGGVASFTSELFGGQAFANLSSTTYTNLGMKFGQDVRHVGFWINDAGFRNTLADLITFRALDAVGNLIYSTDITIPAAELDQGKLFVGIDSTTPIDRVEWLSNGQGFFAVDNVSYAVPEPAGLAGLMLPALAAMCRRTRRRA